MRKIKHVRETRLVYFSATKWSTNLKFHQSLFRKSGVTKNSGSNWGRQNSPEKSKKWPHKLENTNQRKKIMMWRTIFSHAEDFLESLCPEGKVRGYFFNWFFFLYFLSCHWKYGYWKIFCTLVTKINKKGRRKYKQRGEGGRIYCN